MATDVYTTAGSQTWTAPTGCTSVQIECWGGGGAGYRTGATSTGGGGGGAYSKKNSYSVTPGTGYTVYVGAGAEDSTSPYAGEDSYFVNSSTCMAKGGSSASGTSGASGGSSSSSVGDTKYSGGSGGTGNTSGVGSYAGGGGSSAGTSSVGDPGDTGASGGYGGTAPSGGGNGSRGGVGTSYGGNYASNASAPGGGGGGAGYVDWSGTNYGGHGADGKVILTYTTATTPTVTTTTATSITSNTASSGGNVTSDGGATVTARGLVWNKTGGATIASYTGKTTDGSGTGSYTSSLTSLNMDRIYYYRAYATNSQGTSYGNDLNFNTLKILVPGVLAANPAAMAVPSVTTTTSLLFLLEKIFSASTSARLLAPTLSIGLSPPQLQLSLPDLTNIRVDWF